jgi:DNA invertase Pin-like site-specific DNA recombinase
MTSQMIGYSRVSTTDQHADSQEDALRAAGCTRVFTDQFTGTKASRPEWDRARDVLRDGDTLVVTRLDRLGRSTKDLLDIAEWLKSNHIELVCTDQQIDTTSVEGKLFFTLVSAFAEFEHGMMRARTIEGLAAAKSRGRVGGRKPKLTPQQVKAIRTRYQGGEGATALAASFNVSRPTVYRALGATQ